MTPAQAKELTVSGVLAAALAVAGGVAAVSGGYFKDEAEKRELLMRRQSLEAGGRLSRANEEREQISAYMQRYQNYVRIKVIKPVVASAEDTPEQGERLEWIERLVEAREARGLPQLTYTIAARKPYEDIAKPGQGLSFFASRMKLELGLLHEGDFIDYLRRLSNPPAGIFVIDRCTLQARNIDTTRTAARAPAKKPAPGALATIGSALGNAAGNSPAPADQANVTATCEIDWITLVEDARAASAGGAKK